MGKLPHHRFHTRTTRSASGMTIYQQALTLPLVTCASNDGRSTAAAIVHYTPRWGNSGNRRTTFTWRFKPGRRTVLTYLRIDCVSADRRHGPARSSARLSDGLPYGLRGRRGLCVPFWSDVRQSSDIGLCRRAGCFPATRCRRRAWHTGATSTTFCRSGFRKRRAT
jgi:hypothetical protein